MLTQLSHTARGHLPRDGAAHGGLGTPTSTVNQNTLSQTGQSDGGNTSLEIPSSQVTHGCAK